MGDKNETTAKRLTISIPNNIYELIKDDAEYDERSLNYIIVKILKKHYKLIIGDD